MTARRSWPWSTGNRYPLRQNCGVLDHVVGPAPALHFFAFITSTFFRCLIGRTETHACGAP